MSEVESGSDCQDAFLSQEDRLGKAGAAILTIPKAEKDVDDFDVRSADQIVCCGPVEGGVISLACNLSFLKRMHSLREDVGKPRRPEGRRPILCVC